MSKVKPKVKPIIKIKKKEGVSARAILIPTVVVIVILHALIVGNTIRINRAGQQISLTTRDSFAYSQAAKSYQSTAGLLADKARLFASTGDPEYVTSYFLDMQSFYAQQAAIVTMDTSNLTDSANVLLDSASRVSRQRATLEYRAMRLYGEGAGVDMNAYPEVVNASLSPEESLLTPEEKRQSAAALLVSPEYLQLRSQFNDYIDRSIQIVTDKSTQTITAQQNTLHRFQILQWSMMVTIILLLSVMCVLLFVLLLGPLERSVDDIQRGETIIPDKGLAEFRRLSFAYNELLHHRKMMESYLRQQSQTDPLTGLPNRLAFQNFISDLSWERAHSSVIVFSLDVNGLKETNDTKGHTFGDMLLKNCGACIQATLGNGPGKHCFRFGGDEFAAFWVNVPTGELESALRDFEAEQEKREVSISVGCAYTQDLSETTVDALFEEADKHMYDDKAEYHRRQAQAVLDQLKLFDY